MVLQKFLVGTLFHNLSLVHNNDKIRITDRAQPVGDDDTRAVFHNLVHGTLDCFLRAGIHVGCSFIQD